MKHLLFVFLDGVGIGANNVTINPFLEADIPTWQALAGGNWPTLGDLDARRSADAILLPADATLGIPGEPQSGTGTTALLTGINAPAHFGSHMGPYPPQEIRPLLQAKNLLTQATQKGLSATFANAFPPFYFDRLKRGTARRTTCVQATLAAGVPLRTYDDLLSGRALSGWITNEHWRRVASEVPDITPFQGGQHLGTIAQQHHITLFEYFHTDHVGHRPNLTRAHETLKLLDHFLAGILSILNPQHDLLILASDHGNFEDQSHSKHTRNPTLVTLWGHRHADVADSISAITDIVPALWRWLETEG